MILGIDFIGENELLIRGRKHGDASVAIKPTGSKELVVLKSAKKSETVCTVENWRNNDDKRPSHFDSGKLNQREESNETISMDECNSEGMSTESQRERDDESVNSEESHEIVDTVETETIKKTDNTNDRVIVNDTDLMITFPNVKQKALRILFDEWITSYMMKNKSRCTVETDTVKEAVEDVTAKLVSYMEHNDEWKKRMEKRVQYKGIGRNREDPKRVRFLGSETYSDETDSERSSDRDESRSEDSTESETEPVTS